MKQFFRQHYMAIIVAVAVGSVVAFPQLLFIFQAGDEYRGINITETDSEQHYGARIREVYDGHFSIASPVLAEKDVPYIYPPLPELVMGLVGRVLNLNITGVLVLFRFLAPAGLFLLIYFFGLRLTAGNKPAALTAATVIILASNLISYPQEFLQMLGGTFSANQFTDFARPINPQISALLFFGFLYVFWRFVETNEKRYVWWSLVIFGLSFYVYQYTWTFLCTVLCLSALFWLWRKDMDRFKNALMIFGGGLVIGSLYLINFYQVLTHDSYHDLVNYNGLYQSRMPLFSSLLLLSALLLGPLYFLKRSLFWFFTLLVASGVIAINQQIITGQVIQSGHYHWAMNRPVLILLLVIIAFSVFDRFNVKKVFQYTFLSLAIVVSFFNAYQHQISSYRSHYDKYLTLQDYEPAVRWLSDQGERDQVVYVASDLSNETQPLNQLIPMYTSLNVYYDPKASLSLTNHRDYDEYNFFIKMKLTGIAPAGTVDYLRKNPELLTNLFGMYFKARGQNFADISNENLAALADHYRTFYELPWSEVWNGYPLDYIIWDHNNLPDLPIPFVVQSVGFKEVYNKDGIVIYQR